MHRVFALHAHRVVVTKTGTQVFAARHLGHMEQITGEMCVDTGCDLAEFHEEAEHVHRLVNFAPACPPPSPPA